MDSTGSDAARRERNGKRKGGSGGCQDVVDSGTEQMWRIVILKRWRATVYRNQLVAMATAHGKSSEMR